jgi:hypothetical protein
MRRRLGDHPRPSTVLTGFHMRWIDRYYYSLYLHAKTSKDRKRMSRAAVAHLSSYVGWLRGAETFGLCWRDVTAIHPDDGPTLGLPPGVGVILLKLLLQTKSSQFAQADVVIAFTTASGLSLGTWLERLRAELTPAELDPAAFVLAKPSRAAWTSHYYRHRFLYPALYAFRDSGDAFLQAIDGSPGNSIPERFWSFNTQRRSGRSEASRKRPWTLRKASPAEVVEHGRWRLSRSSLDMPLAYLEWSVEDRSCLTACCM